MNTLRLHVTPCPFALDATIYQDCPRDVHGIEADRCPACPKRPEWRDPFDEPMFPLPRMDHKLTGVRPEDDDVRQFDLPRWVAGVLFFLVIVTTYIVVVVL